MVYAVEILVSSVLFIFIFFFLIFQHLIIALGNLNSGKVQPLPRSSLVDGEGPFMRIGLIISFLVEFLDELCKEKRYFLEVGERPGVDVKGASKGLTELK